jgi:hypothetical protein
MLTAIHMFAGAGLVDGEWELRCGCGAWFRSPISAEATEAYRRHLAEPALPRKVTP